MGLREAVDEVLDECYKRLPNSARQIDYERLYAYPQLFTFPLAYEPVMQRACEVRRIGANSRAEALEWAYDSIMASTGYVRVGEIYKAKLTGDGGEPQDGFCALVRERHELD